MYAGYFFRLLSPGKVGKRRDRRHPLDPLGPRDPSSYLEYSPVKFRKRYQSHFEALGLHLFVRDAERCSDDCANSSNPTYSKGCTQSTQNTHIHTHHVAKHLLPSSASVSQASSELESRLWHSGALVVEAVATLQATVWAGCVSDKWVRFSLSRFFCKSVPVCSRRRKIR